MQINKTNQNPNFTAKLVIKGYSKKVGRAFSKIVTSEEIFPKNYHEKWYQKALTFNNFPFGEKKLLAVGEPDYKELKQIDYTIEKLEDGSVSKENFDKHSQNVQVLSARKVLRAIKNNKFDFKTLTIIK